MLDDINRSRVSLFEDKEMHTLINVCIAIIFLLIMTGQAAFAVSGAMVENISSRQIIAAEPPIIDVLQVNPDNSTLPKGFLTLAPVNFYQNNLGDKILSDTTPQIKPKCNFFQEYLKKYFLHQRSMHHR